MVRLKDAFPKEGFARFHGGGIATAGEGEKHESHTRCRVDHETIN